MVTKQEVKMEGAIIEKTEKPNGMKGEIATERIPGVHGDGNINLIYRGNLASLHTDMKDTVQRNIVRYTQEVIDAKARLNTSEKMMEEIVEEEAIREVRKYNKLTPEEKEAVERKKAFYERQHRHPIQ